MKKLVGKDFLSLQKDQLLIFICKYDDDCDPHILKYIDRHRHDTYAFEFEFEFYDYECKDNVKINIKEVMKEINNFGNFYIPENELEETSLVLKLLEENK